MPTADVDVAEILGVLNSHHVDYVVIGGFAIELWDVAVPPTQDVDVTPAMGLGNLKRLCKALDGLDARLRVSGSEPVAIPDGWTPDLISQMKVLNLATKYGPLDLTIQPAGTDGFAELSQGAVVHDFQGVKVPTAALEDVLHSKESAGREKDLRTIPAIRAHIERRARKRSQ